MTVSMTYLITFACYGSHLHGNQSGSVDPAHNVPGTPTLEADSARAAREEQGMAQSPYHLDQVRREAVLEAIQEVCRYRGGVCWRSMCEAITCIQLWKQKRRRSKR